MNEPLRITVLSPYPFHMVDQARQLHRAGVLDRFVTAVPRRRVGLPSDLVSSRLRCSALSRVVGRAAPMASPFLNRQVVRDFDRWAASQLGRATVVNGLSGFATETLSRASSQGRTIFCERGSWHILEQRRVLDEEADRICAPRADFDPFMIERELREYELADRILVPSEQARQSFIRQGVLAGRVVKVPFGVDISSFTPPTAGRCSGALVSVATVGLRKGHHHLMEAFRRLNTQNASMTLIGPVSSGWEKRLALDSPSVRALGAVKRSRVIEELQRASVFVLASIEEGLALVIPQAMACGLPIIATEATGAAELVTNGVEGILVGSPPDAATLAEAMDALLSDSRRAQAMGDAGRRKVESFGGWERYRRQLLSTFRDGRSETT